MKITVIVVVVLVVLALLGLLLSAQRKKAHSQRVERERVEEALRLDQARDHRERAEEVQLEADRQAGEAQAQAARARQEQLAAERQLHDAEQRRTEAAGLHAQADELDPERQVTPSGSQVRTDDPHALGTHRDDEPVVDGPGRAQPYDDVHEGTSVRVDPYPGGVDRRDPDRSDERR